MASFQHWQTTTAYIEKVVLKDQTGSNTGSMMCTHTVKEQSQMSLMSTLYQPRLHFRTAPEQMELMPRRQTQTLPGLADCSEEQDFLGQWVNTIA